MSSTAQPGDDSTATAAETGLTENAGPEAPEEPSTVTPAADPRVTDGGDEWDPWGNWNRTHGWGSNGSGGRNQGLPQDQTGQAEGSARADGASRRRAKRFGGLSEEESAVRKN